AIIIRVCRSRTLRSHGADSDSWSVCASNEKGNGSSGIGKNDRYGGRVVSNRPTFWADMTALLILLLPSSADGDDDSQHQTGRDQGGAEAHAGVARRQRRRRAAVFEDQHLLEIGLGKTLFEKFFFL